MTRPLLGPILALLVLAACTPVRNPATGEVQYTSLSPEEERQLGRAEHPKALVQFGGRYDDPALQSFVTRVGGFTTRGPPAGRP